MTADQRDYLASKSLDLRIPDGQLVQRIAENAGNQVRTSRVTRERECFQTGDFDGDGNDDFVGLYEYTGSKTRSGAWKLDLLLLYTDASGETRHVLFPYAGRYSASSGEVHHSLSMQPPGVFDLHPGSVTLDRPGFVISRDGKPEVLYYWTGSHFAHRIIHIDD